MSPVAIFTDLLIASIAGALGYFSARLGGELWAKLILDSQEAAVLRTKLKRCMPLINSFNQRCSILRVSLAQSEVRRRNAERRIDDLRRQLNALQNQDDELIRIVGHRRPGHHLFKAVMVNRHVQTAVREGRSHGLLDTTWARPQEVEIWATGVPEAKSSLNGRFPVSLGFVLIELIEPAESSPETGGTAA